MDGAWAKFLKAPDESGHAVQVYAEPDELAESVAAYLATGFAVGEPALLVVRVEHYGLFMRELAATGWDAAALIEAGLLTRLDADETLELLLDGAEISRERFITVVGGAVDAVAERHPEHRVRAFGEMVDVLTHRGLHDAATAVERLWNELAESRRFALLCGYRLDVFDPPTQRERLPAICDVHTHVLPAQDVAQLDRAVYDAVDEVLGSSSARMVHGIVRDGAAEHSAPVSQQMLQWISERMPRHAERVLAVARANYER